MIMLLKLHFYIVPLTCLYLGLVIYAIWKEESYGGFIMQA
jgi:hypothetical protein